MQPPPAHREESAIKTVVTGDTPYTSAKSFEDLPISDELRQGLYVEMKFEKPSKIQAETLPMILSPPFQNLIAQAHNGSGKTTCVDSRASRMGLDTGLYSLEGLPHGARHWAL